MPEVAQRRDWAWAASTHDAASKLISRQIPIRWVGKQGVTGWENTK